MLYSAHTLEIVSSNDSLHLHMSVQPVSFNQRGCFPV